MKLRSFFSISILLAFSFLTVTGTSAQTINKKLPKHIDSSAKYLFYLHGRIVEEQGINAVSPQYGAYEYKNILKVLSLCGFNVISEARPKNTDAQKYAKVVAAQVNKLLKAHVPAENIIILGASKGAYITAEVSPLVNNPEVKYILMGMCNDEDVNLHRQLSKKSKGLFFSVYDASDTFAGSCFNSYGLASNLESFNEVSINMNLGHGFIYRPYEQWVVPVINWIYTGKVVTSNIADQFYAINPFLDAKVQEAFDKLTDEQRIAQMIITSAGKLGKPDKVVKELIRKQHVGGVILMENNKEKHIQMVKDLNALNREVNGIPLMYSMDAEPSLLSGRIIGAKAVPNAINIKSDFICAQVAKSISGELREIGVHQNFAPVADVSPKNKIIKNRAFCSNSDSVCQLSNVFIRETQAEGILATIKHFPGHGLVKGDTHEQSVFIDGDLAELPVFQKLIQGDVLSVMVGHLTVRNNEKYQTEGLPATCSRKIITGLLKEELGFRGLIVTDAMNIMKAVNSIENAPLLASKAGTDLILMPINEDKVINSILKEMNEDPAYREQVYNSVKKILRMKACLKLF